jgi:hypothetical protein
VWVFLGEFISQLLRLLGIKTLKCKLSPGNQDDFIGG